MGVEGDRVGPLDPVEQRPQLGCEHGRPAVGRVDVQPQPVLGAQVGDRGQRVDGAGGGGAGRRDDHERPHAGPDVVGHGPAQVVEAHPVAVVGGDGAHGPLAQTEHVGRLGDRRVGLRGGVEHEAQAIHAVPADVPVGARVASRLERGQVRGRPAARHQAAGACRQAEPLRQPPHQMQLELGRGRRDRPSAHVGVESGRQQVARRAGDRARARHVRHEPGVAAQRRLLDDERTQQRAQVGDRERLGPDRQGGGRGDIGGVERTRDGQVAHPCEQLAPQVEHGARQVACLVRAPVEVGDGLRAAHRSASRPIVRPGARSPTRRIASSVPGTNASREVVSWRSVRVWPGAPKITS